MQVDGETYQPNNMVSCCRQNDDRDTLEATYKSRILPGGARCAVKAPGGEF